MTRQEDLGGEISLSKLHRDSVEGERCGGKRRGIIWLNALLDTGTENGSSREWMEHISLCSLT